MSGFTHLHVHTQYSLLDGAARIDDLVKKAAALGMNAMAITDHGAMYGVIDFYKACKAQKIKPILGLETYVAPNSMQDKAGMREYAHLILLAKNEQGYQNLVKLSSLGFTEGFYYRPRIDYGVLEQYREGLICLSACLAGDIPTMLLEGRDREAHELALRLKGMFGEDFYIELQNHGLEEQQIVLPKLDALAKRVGVKTVATNDIHYVDKADAEAQDVLLCVQTQRTVNDENRMRMEASEFYLKREDEMRQMLYNYPEAIETTSEIADKCNVEIVFGERRLPHFSAPDGIENRDYLAKLCEEGLVRKMPGASDAERERLRYEVSVIAEMGFVDYFLIVWDFVRFAHERGIFVGPGRGSGAGSLVAYALDITDVDPIKYDLIFERFLNPERISMPDFDIDFCIERRQEVLDYVIEKYGADHVSQIITFGSLAARAAIRDVGRALGMPYAEVDRIAKLVPRELNITLERALEVSSELREQYETNDEVKRLLDLSKKLEGLPRNPSTHAAGVVISSKPITDFVPLQTNDGAVTTQFPKDTIEELGLLKMDFLGLRTLTVIRDALEFIRQSGKQVPDLDKLEFDDPKVYALIASGDTDGIFQLESAGMRQFMVQLRPDNFEDIIAGISLYRPGPMDQIPRYIQGKNNRHNVKYLHEKLRPILEKTYGCMVYQEQVMEIVREVAGYSWGRSDLVRRAMSKKNHDVMEKEREYFVNGIVENGVVVVPGAIRNGVPAQAANRMFDEMVDFASYAFNKSHAAAYAVVAYRTAYLKLYYPVEFFTALINSFLGTPDKVAEYVYACKRQGISVLAPDINESGVHFTVSERSTRFGLAAIRNVGESVTMGIIAEREQKGKFRDFFDFIHRCEGLNKRAVEGLIKAGCFDRMGARRAQLMAVFEQAMDAASDLRKRRGSGQISLFDMAIGGNDIIDMRIPLPDIPEFDGRVLLSMERECIGIFISGHPLLEFENTLRGFGVTASELTQADGDGDIRDNRRVKLGGIVTSMRSRATRSGSGMMGYGTLEDLSGSIELAVFPSVFVKYRSLLQADSLVIVSGRLNIREDQPNSILVDEVLPLAHNGKSKKEEKLYLRMDTANTQLAGSVCEALRRFPGNMPVVLFDPFINKKKEMDKEFYVNPAQALTDMLEEILGEENVKYS